MIAPFFEVSLILATFLVSIWYLSEDEKNNFVMTMRQEMALPVDLIKHTSVGIAAPWTEETSPLAASSRRALGKSPTGPDLDPIAPTQAKIPRLA